MAEVAIQPRVELGSHKSSYQQLPVFLSSSEGSNVDHSAIGWMRPSSPDTPLEELHSRFDNEGYILVKGLIPRKDVLNMRSHYFEHMKPTGILEPDTPSEVGIFNRSAKPMAHTGIGAPEMTLSVDAVSRLAGAHSTPDYLSFLENPALRKFIRSFMDWKNDVLLKRTMLRHAVPGAPSTGVHYDQLFLRGGNPRDEFLTAWVPIGDVAADGGGLMYLEDSTHLGRDIEADFTERAKTLPEQERKSAFNVNMSRTGQLTQDAEKFRLEKSPDKRWLVANYEAGDVVFHNPYMVHCAASNRDKMGRIRLSTDLRFYEEHMEIDKRWMNIWAPDDGL